MVEIVPAKKENWLAERWQTLSIWPQSSVVMVQTDVF